MARSQPGERIWRTRDRSRRDRFLSPVRTGGLAIATTAWLFFPRPSPQPVLAGASALAVWVAASAHTALLRREDPFAAWGPWACMSAEIALLIAFIWSAGGHSGRFLPLLMVATIWAPLSLPVAGGLAATAACTVAAILLAGPGRHLDAVYVPLVGFGLTYWTAIAEGTWRAAVHDPLTGAFGREFGLFELARQLDCGPLPLTAGILDMDGLKQINDQHGHATGDTVLSACARVIASLIREDDVLVRYGGDEFLLILPGTGLDEAMAVAERVRAAVRDTTFSERGRRAGIRLSVSIGLREVSQRNVDPQDCLRAADACLYTAKRDRNRVVGLAANERPA